MSASRDLDGDSQMGDVNSSSSSDDAMFPSANNTDVDPTTSKTQQILSFPPNSQPNKTSQIEEAMEPIEDMEGNNAGFGKSAEDRFVPGSSWNTKKAKDEYTRAWTIVEDKDFSLRPFGDPFDETLPENKGRKTA